MTTEFKEAIESAGLVPPELTPGKWLRFPGIGKKASNRAGFAFLFEDGLGGVFGDFSCGLQHTWQADKVASYTPEARADFDEMVREQRGRANEEQEKEWGEASEKAIARCQRIGLIAGDFEHKYLKKKGVKAYGLRLDDNKLLYMPIMDARGVVMSYQTIDLDGKKLLMAGGKKKGCAFIIKGDKSKVYVVEGYSTGATVHEATGNMVVVAVDAGNLMPVVEVLVQKGYRDVVIAADNDAEGEHNVGVEKARAVAERFAEVSYLAPPEAGDWNDYATKHGLDRVRALLTPSRIRSISAAVLIGKTFQPLKWAVPGIIPEGLTILAGRPKFGKALAHGTSILTPTGWKPIEDMEIADEVYTRSGEVTKVTGVFPQGVRACYEITFTDNGSCVADEEHLWLVKHRSSGEFNKVKTTKELAEHLDKYSTHGRVYIPLAQRVKFPTRDIALDPYLLGVLLGDGGLTKTNVTLTSGDAEVFNNVNQRIPNECILKMKSNILGTIVGRKWRNNPVLSALQNYGLMGKKSEHKFIPEDYLWNDIYARLELLRGLMDTDGTIHGNNNVEFNTTSPQLAESVGFLVQSLGGKCRKIRTRFTFYKYNGEKKRGLKSYRVRFQLPINPFKLKRKADKYKTGKVTNGSRLVKSIKQVPASHCTCISVADESHLFVTQDFIVTHNSWLMMGLAYAVATGGLAWNFAATNKASVHALFLEDSHRRLKSRMEHMEGYFDTFPDNLHFYVDFPRIGEGFAEELDAILERDPECGLIIIDTLQKIRPKSGGGSRHIYQADYEDYEQLQKWSIQNGVPSICIHHTRKGEAGQALNPFDEISGSTGLQGVADTLIVVCRDKEEDVGKMYVTGREVSEETYPIEFDYSNCTWTVMPPEGSSYDPTESELETWWKDGHETITVKEATKVWKASQRVSRTRLDELVEAGALCKRNQEGEGKGRRTIEYHRSSQAKYKEESGVITEPIKTPETPKKKEPYGW